MQSFINSHIETCFTSSNEKQCKLTSISQTSQYDPLITQKEGKPHTMIH